LDSAIFFVMDHIALLNTPEKVIKTDLWHVTFCHLGNAAINPIAWHKCFDTKEDAYDEVHKHRKTLHRSTGVKKAGSWQVVDSKGLGNVGRDRTWTKVYCKKDKHTYMFRHKITIYRVYCKEHKTFVM
jgi:hypothetical protein